MTLNADANNLWQICNGNEYITPLAGILYRLVESQEQIATLNIVDTLDEQALLEELLDSTKPPYPQSVNSQLHYLLKTPFRYPPLKWGSRFGRTFEPSIFYGGCSIAATLAESAYYRFVFLHSIENMPGKGIHTQHTMFSVGYRTEKGCRLQEQPFDNYLGQIAHPTDYQWSQSLGTAMRNSKVEAFEYPSARASDHSTCVGLFTMDNFTQNQPSSSEQWLCDVTKGKVIFKALLNSEIHVFNYSDFLQNGDFPNPA